MPNSSPPDVWDVIAREAALESELWAGALRPASEHECDPVFSPLAATRFETGIETIYEGYLAHYGRPRLFAPADPDTAVLLGDYLYAHGLVRVAALGDVGAVADLAALISLCARLRGDGRAGDGFAWAATSAVLGRGDGRLGPALATLGETGHTAPLAQLATAEAGDEVLRRALAAHERRLR